MPAASRSWLRVVRVMGRFWHTGCMTFAHRLIAWQQRQGRHDLPWQNTRDPYRIWLSEIMLQQTRVETVIPYYQRFLARFPDLAALATAPLDEVMAHWAGLGYYSRARNLHAAARLLMDRHGGVFPRERTAIQALPGIGRSTAAAIAAFAFGQRCAILDGNVKRVLARVFGVEGWPGEKTVEDRLWQLAESLLPERDIHAYTQGLMDLGAGPCARRRPDCSACPFSAACEAHRLGLEAEIPGARPKKSLPEKSTTMLVLLHAGAVLLEKRPPSGIWGGLWSLPECSPDEDPVRAAVRLGYRGRAGDGGAAFSHVFTHFRLHIQPWLMAVEAPVKAGEPGCIWLPLADLDGAAVPAPVRKILLGCR